MVDVVLDAPASYRAWRAAARGLLARGIAPERVHFRLPGEPADLFAEPFVADPGGAPARRVPKAFADLASQVVCHRDARRFALLYRLVWRLGGEPRLLDDASDADVWDAQRMAKSVRRDAHKMKAFVRFRRIEDARGEAFVAWFEPEHHVVEYTAPFFAKRFTGMRWSIVTPERSAHWDGVRLRFGDGAARADCPDADALEAYWRTYYASIFNPARLKVKAMTAEMPKKYWRNLPESALIPDLVRDAQRAQKAAPAGTPVSRARARELVAAQPGMAPAPAPANGLDALARELEGCRRCPLYGPATRAVPGCGPRDARLMLVGEQPGDQEDLTGKPFVGPAGEMLDRALAAAGIERDGVYLTNAVKHFKFQRRGKRRLHQRPGAGEIEHCRWWLDQERALLGAPVTVALGATAARALLGEPVPVQKVRGEALCDAAGRTVVVTVHPAYLLRLPDAARAERAFETFAGDLALAARLARA